MNYFLTFFTGFLLVTSNIFNARFGQKLNILNGVMLNYIISLIALFVLYFFIPTETFNADTFAKTPAFLFLGGAISLVVVSGTNFVLPRIPIVYFVLLSFSGQVFCGLLIDFIMEGKFEVNKLLGGILLLTGLFINTLIDNKVKNKEESSDVSDDVSNEVSSEVSN